MNMSDLDNRAAVSVPEAGELLGICRRSAYNAARRGDIPTITVGRRQLVPVPALLRLLGHEASSPSVEPVAVSL